MKTFNAHVNSYYAPKFEAETLADAIDFANANFLNNVGAPKKFTARTIGVAVNGRWVPAFMILMAEAAP